MSVRTTALLLALFVLIISCQPSDKKDQSPPTLAVQEVQRENISVILPKFLTANDKLHDEAIIGYQNLLKEFYFIVIRENKNSFDSAIVVNEMDTEFSPNLEGYAKFIQARLGENVEEVKTQTEIRDMDIAGGQKAKYFETDADVSGVSIHYEYALVEGKADYYQVLTWTLGSRTKKNKAAMMDILKSFRELPAK